MPDPAPREDPTALLTADALARAYLARAKAPNTLRAYQADWRCFTAWCAAHGTDPLPATAETLARYLALEAAAGRTVSTLARRLAAIGQAHQAAGYGAPATHPAVRAVWQGIRRTHGTAPRRKAPAVPATLQRMLATRPADTPLGRRDRALLLLGFAGALRRSELVALDVADVEERPEGLVLTVRRGKTDPEGQGRQLGIPYGRRAELCPVRALRDWREIAGISEGPLFRPLTRSGRVGAARLSDRAVARVVQGAAAAAGLEAAQFAGHSLRAGLATAAAAAGVEERDIARQTGHRSVTVLRTYIRAGEVFRHNAAAAVL